jgi:predicted regulator of Ras-like GTPase activity (Roadblock/LC7/MglB family)
MAARDQIKDALAAWAQQRQGVHYALVSREGLPVASKLPNAVHEETFAIMSATMLGAASTVNNELRGDEPEFITVKAVNFETFLSGVTKDLLVVLIIPNGTSREEAVDFLRSLHKIK